MSHVGLRGTDKKSGRLLLFTKYRNSEKWSILLCPAGADLFAHFSASDTSLYVVRKSCPFHPKNSVLMRRTGPGIRHRSLPKQTGRPFHFSENKAIRQIRYTVFIA